MTLKSILVEYGTKKVHYAVITFGETAVIRMKFKDNIKTKEELAALVANLPSTRGSPNLDNALTKGIELFSIQEGGRLDARKVLVVMVDTKDESVDEVDKKVKELGDSKIKVVPVVVGSEVKPEDLAPVEPDKNKEKVVKTDKNEDPDRLSKRLVQQILQGMHFIYARLRYQFHLVKITK